MKILVANLGSTSFKYRLFDMSDERQLARGGVERIGAAEPAAVILDHRLPPHDDYRASIRHLRKAGFAGPVVVISAAVGDRVFAEAPHHGVFEVIDKLRLWEEIDAGLLDRILPTMH